MVWNPKIGDKKWVVDTETEKEIIICFIGNQEVAVKEGGELKTYEFTELYNSQEDARQNRLGLTLTIICHETSKDTGETIIYPINEKVDGGLIAALSLRSRYNPELEYFVLMGSIWDQIKKEPNRAILKLLEKKKKLIQL